MRYEETGVIALSTTSHFLHLEPCKTGWPLWAILLHQCLDDGPVDCMCHWCIMGRIVWALTQTRWRDDPNSHLKARPWPCCCQLSVCWIFSEKSKHCPQRHTNRKLDSLACGTRNASENLNIFFFLHYSYAYYYTTLPWHRHPRDNSDE